MSDEIPISIPPIIPKPQPVRVTAPAPSPPLQIQKEGPTPGQPQVQPPVQAPTPPPVRGFTKARQSINVKEVFFRLAIVFLLAVSLFLVWWSFTQVLAKREKEVKDLNSRITTADREIDDLQRAWTDEQSAEVAKRYDHARSMLLSGEDSVAVWWQNLLEHADQLKLQLSEPKLQPLTTVSNQLGIAAATLTIEITPTPGVTGIETPYQRFLRLSQHLATLDTRCDMPQLTISGGTNSFTKATMLLNLWSVSAPAEETKK
jgi:cell division protein FtsL